MLKRISRLSTRDKIRRENIIITVHKTAPQVIALRELTGKSNFTGMAFIGVRASESISRSEYDYVSLGEKHKGQYSCNPILEWNSAELYMYIYSEDIYLSERIKKVIVELDVWFVPGLPKEMTIWQESGIPRSLILWST